MQKSADKGTNLNYVKLTQIVCESRRVFCNLFCIVLVIKC